MSNSKVERKAKGDAQFEAMMKRAIRILEGDPQVTLNSVAVSENLCHKVLKRHYTAFKESGEDLKNLSPKLVLGRFPLLSETQKHILQLFVRSLNCCGFPCSKETLKMLSKVSLKSSLMSLCRCFYCTKMRMSNLFKLEMKEESKKL